MTGVELKATRKNLGLSLAQASRQVEVTPRTWARWESGKSDIPSGALKLFRMVNKLPEDVGAESPVLVTEEDINRLSAEISKLRRLLVVPRK